MCGCRPEGTPVSVLHPNERTGQLHTPATYRQLLAAAHSRLPYWIAVCRSTDEHPLRQVLADISFRPLRIELWDPFHMTYNINGL